MAFVREKKMMVNGKEYGGYYQLVEGYREGGKVKQRLVRYLGKFDSKEEAERASLHPSTPDEVKDEFVAFEKKQAAKKKAPAKKKAEPMYIKRLKALSETWSRNINPLGFAEDVKEAFKVHKKAKEASGAAYTKLGADSEEYKEATAAEYKASVAYDESQVPYDNKADAARNKAEAIYDGLSPYKQKRVRDADIGIIKHILHSRESHARFVGRVGDFYDLF